MKKELEFICIGCPMGCQVTVIVDESGDVAKVKGHGCKEGKEYVQSEYKNPVRVLTTTVLVEGSKRRTLPVRTNRPIPKASLQEAMLVLAQVKAKPPLKTGQTIVPNILNTGADVVATDLITD
jgi:CxxC motif-containing protein